PIDYNGDSLVDSFDYSMLESCLSGPSGVVPDGCDCVDLDDDNDTDLADFAKFQELYSQ
ncbi:MAG: hypothetical protein GY842_09050, partial [bacterium]|nr:hypothetical protein [bacterium]